MRPTGRMLLVMLLLGSSLLSRPALAQERVIGLLALPEVFGRGVCDRFAPRPVDLHASPRGTVVGTVFVVKPWTYHSNGGCEGLEVGVRAAEAATFQQLPTTEYSYEEPGVFVLETRDNWFRIRLATGTAWLEASAMDEFFDLPSLLQNNLTYLTGAWDGQVASSPGSPARSATLPERMAEHPVRVRRVSREQEGFWLLVDILTRSGCDGDGEPAVADQGWVPAYGNADSPNLWFYSRGC